MLKSFYRVVSTLFRRKTFENINAESKLARVLNLFDLISLGVGGTMGLGTYVLVGTVAYQNAGPAVAISFVLAAIASGFSGLCYAEFAARVPKAGSLYVYSYMTIGELAAFTIGWNLMLEYVIEAASIARGLRIYLESFSENWFSNSMLKAMALNVKFLAAYPDFFAFTLIVLTTVLLAYGVSASTRVNNILTGVNGVVFVIIIISGAIKASPSNWSISEKDIPANISAGMGGFMPYGISGIVTGAAQCFYGLVGFDSITTCGEEAIRPERNIPLSIIISLVIVFAAYLGLSVVMTMMVPYYTLSTYTPIVDIYASFHWDAIKWIVSLGAIFAIGTSLYGSLFPLPRILYAMSTDGILYSPLGKIHPRTKTPLIATILSGLFTGVVALCFDLNQLMNVMSIGVLTAYTIMALCVLLLRYQPDENLPIGQRDTHIEMCFGICKPVKNNMTRGTFKIVLVAIVACALSATLFCIIFQFFRNALSKDGIFVSLTLLAVTFIYSMVVIARQPTIKKSLHFQVPFVPWIPCLSILFNIYLMCQFDRLTWLRFFLWGCIGYFVYFTYGMWHSEERRRLRLNTKTVCREDTIRMNQEK